MFALPGAEHKLCTRTQHDGPPRSTLEEMECDSFQECLDPAWVSWVVLGRNLQSLHGGQRPLEGSMVLEPVDRLAKQERLSTARQTENVWPPSNVFVNLPGDYNPQSKKPSVYWFISMLTLTCCSEDILVQNGHCIASWLA